MDETPKRRWFRFRISTVLILTAIAAWGMAIRPGVNIQYDHYKGPAWAYVEYPFRWNLAGLAIRPLMSGRVGRRAAICSTTPIPRARIDGYGREPVSSAGW
jgi:hypothetical protein